MNEIILDKFQHIDQRKENKMDASTMTPQQLRELAKKKEQEELDKTVKKGYLKEDLYTLNNGESIYELTTDDFYYGETQMIKEVKAFKDSFELVLEKGTEFDCYLYNGYETWSDNANYGVEDMDSEWAKRWLENITIA
jgi:hypothetical protein